LIAAVYENIHTRKKASDPIKQPPDYFVGESKQVGRPPEVVLCELQKAVAAIKGGARPKREKN
jgi:hypothetical protein